MKMLQVSNFTDKKIRVAFSALLAPGERRAVFAYGKGARGLRMQAGSMSGAKR
jgi:hypothetical protein